MKAFGSLLLLVITILTTQEKIPFEVQITGLEDHSGQIILSVFNSAEGFKKEKPYTEFIYQKKIKAGKHVLKPRLPRGHYGMVILDDEDKSHQMNYNAIGIPREGFGFSGYYHKGLKKPKFEDFAFQLNKADTVIHVKMKYMW